MRRTNRKYGVCFENLEKALAERPETYGHIDILCGGWPCQDNSIAGTRKGHKGQKSGLWREFRRLVELFMPRWVIAENVPGLFSVNGGQDFWQVISDLDSFGYCVAWDVLDSQNFGVAQRRKRIIVVASLGNIGAGKVLFEQEGRCRDFKKDATLREIGLCLSTRDGERQDPKSENLVASVVMATDYKRIPIGQFGNEGNLVAGTIAATHRGAAGRTWEENHIATVDTDGKRETSGVSYELVLPRGVVIGNAVTVNVAKWIAERIIKYDYSA